MSDEKGDKGDEEKVYGGCEGPDAMYVKLVSSDGHEFIVKRDHALTSGTIKAMLSGPGMYYYTNYCIFILVHIRIS
jgi:transcription elongation factor B subunit 1